MRKLVFCFSIAIVVAVVAIFCTGFRAPSTLSYAQIEFPSGHVATVQIASYSYQSCNNVRLVTVSGHVFETASQNVLFKNSL